LKLRIHYFQLKSKVKFEMRVEDTSENTGIVGKARLDGRQGQVIARALRERDESHGYPADPEQIADTAIQEG
jgi:hypothetical protein